MIAKYEVELKITNRNTKQERLVTRQEYANNALDAFQQALMNESVTATSSDLSLVHIGPPAEEVRHYEDKLLEQLAQHVKALGKKVKL